ncbi:carboxymuconolactone decarboxylase family protein [Clostridium sp. WILCCON 0269]|uniref:Carboxymuconolactone decarboxylase family protein n=1 Tax=Candidatus Clostridium eludens TaxID=3381663 RepID=A0ABW8SJ53_9CLOT
MDRIEYSDKVRKELFRNMELSENQKDPEFYDTMNRFLYGEVWKHGNLDKKLREMITIVVLTTNQTMDQCREHIEVALNIGITPVEIKEILYQCTPYIGFARVQNALLETNKVFTERGISMPVEKQSTTTEDTRLEKGITVQKKIFGEEHVDTMRANAPKNLKHIQNYLSAMCFGDFYTRSGLELKTRELLTLCVISALGGCENQLRAHIQGNLNVGNDKDTLINVITQCMPYIGFPRTLNALNCVNEIVQKNNK